MQVTLISGDRILFGDITAFRYVNNQITITHDSGTKIWNCALDLISEINFIKGA